MTFLAASFPSVKLPFSGLQRKAFILLHHNQLDVPELNRPCLTCFLSDFSVIEGGIAQAVPEHPKREFILALSTAFGDAYLFQVLKITLWTLTQKVKTASCRPHNNCFCPPHNMNSSPTPIPWHEFRSLHHDFPTPASDTNWPSPWIPERGHDKNDASMNPTPLPFSSAQPENRWNKLLPCKNIVRKMCQFLLPKDHFTVCVLSMMQFDAVSLLFAGHFSNRAGKLGKRHPLCLRVLLR